MPTFWPSTIPTIKWVWLDFRLVKTNNIYPKCISVNLLIVQLLIESLIVTPGWTAAVAIANENKPTGECHNILHHFYSSQTRHPPHNKS